MVRRWDRDGFGRNPDSAWRMKDKDDRTYERWRGHWSEVKFKVREDNRTFNLVWVWKCGKKLMVD